MAKIFCLLNDQNKGVRQRVEGSLNYNPSWQKKIFQNEDIFLGCFELPFKQEPDFWREDENFVIVIDGEIMAWNQDVKGSSTTEKLLNIFKDKKEELVHAVNGTFTIVIWDKKSKVLFVLNDRIGLRPLYYAQYRGKTFFASETKAIIADPEFNKEYNKDSVVDYFTYGYVMGDRTLFAGINVFPFAHTLCFDPAEPTLKMKRYWDLDFHQEIPNEQNIAAYAWRLKEVFEKAVDRTMQGPYKVGLPLSGGLDSRAIGAMIGRQYYPLNTYTFGIKGCVDMTIARKISRIMGANHHCVEIKYAKLADFMVKGIFLTDGMAWCNNYQILNIKEEMQQNDQVALTGFAGDMLYRRMYSHCHGKDVECVYSLYDIYKEKFRKKIFTSDFQGAIDHGKGRFIDLWDDIRRRKSENSLDYLNVTQRQRKFINHGNLLMRNFIEVRTPYTDYDFLDFCLKMPLMFKEKEFLYREMLDTYYRPFARVPQEATGLSIKPSRWEKRRLLVKKTVLARYVARHQRAYNYDLWYRTHLKEFVKSVLLSPEFRNRQIFNQQEVEQMLQDHFDGKGNYSYQLGIILSFELWNRAFLDAGQKLSGVLVDV
jgi:asparagine synthase (glutamine-hydrolysing)